MNSILSPIRFVFWGIWSAICMSGAIVASLLTFNSKIALWMAKNIWVHGALFIPGVRLSTNKNSSIDYSKPYVFVANHQSYIDIPVAIRAVDCSLFFIAKKELKWLPFLGWYIMATGMILIDRSNRRKAFESLKSAADMIKNGKSILAFPEGTRSKNGELNTFKKGPFMLAIQAGVPIVPIAISGTENIFPATKMKLIPGKVKLTICDAISTEGYTKETIEELMTKVKESIRVAKAELDV
ncbi:MAG: 1-acyl-sn-glycerol-3-phosphate acyltransferase [Flavobacteriales bacterium]|nr:1-acyl-sn-glycerol-3-phosphate acyltransferase [Flavobacteriales bacterium]